MPKAAGKEPPAAANDPAAKPDASTEGAKPAATNRLAHESSPYLLLHAHNPVDWYPWGDEALAKAKKENKPIFLSIGYSSCYWCHVMERESFTDKEIAAILNAHFVCIKVDREERPDIDEIYMTALHVSGQQGGWPLSVFLTPDAKPFFGGTYFPPRDNQRDTGFLPVIETVHRLWSDKAKQPDLIAQAEKITGAIRTSLEQKPIVALEPLDAKVLDRLESAMMKEFDPSGGGFGRRGSKFPMPSYLTFLLDRARRSGEREPGRLPDKAQGDRPALRMLTATLDAMARGGIRDHLGGGFHRYSVDPHWNVPHFEKMLYDNAQLAVVYAQAYELTGNETYRRVVDETLQFVLREMTDKTGGFYSALDAETDATEGKFYVWTRDQLEAALRAPRRLPGEAASNAEVQLALFLEIYGDGGKPQFEQHYFVPQLDKPLAKWVEEKKTTPEKLLADLAPIRDALMAARAKRKRPLTDTKILTGWNGLMIRGFADAGRITKNDRYLDAASRAADFVLTELHRDGRLLRTFTAGKASLNAYLSDYAYLCDGLIALHRATGKRRWLDAARELTDKQIELFSDPRGGFYRTSKDHQELIARSNDASDNVLPAGATVTAGNLLYLSETLDEPKYRKLAKATLDALARRFHLAPQSVPRGAVVLAHWLESEKKHDKAKRKRGADEEKKPAESP